MKSDGDRCLGQSWRRRSSSTPRYRIRGLRDSKLLDREARREQLAQRIREHAIAWAVAAVDVAHIDQINIYWASKRAMEEAVATAERAARPSADRRHAIDFECAQTPIIHGDALSASIAAASIIAKVERDAMISAWDPVFPDYGLASNKGYSTPKHLKSCARKGQRRCIGCRSRRCGRIPPRRRCWSLCWKTTAAIRRRARS